MRVSELIEQLVTADPDSVVLFLDSYADIDESDEIQEVLVDSHLWTYETGEHHGIGYEVRYPGGPRATDGVDHKVTMQLVERVVVLSDGPTNLRYVTPFQPNEREQMLIERALASHRRAQKVGRYAPSRLVRKWGSENSIPTSIDTFAQRKKRRFLGVSRLSNRGLMTVPLAVRSVLGPNAGTRLYWYLSGEGFASLKAELSRLRKRGGGVVTMPDERTRALIYARSLLLQLSRVPPELDACGLRELAAHVLRHYPDDGMIRLIAAESIWLEWPRRAERDIK
ncbi:BPSL0761 family protein [Paraburkholderia tagetis]|uniref:Uncharacterized protein n=1 Tax=Paraburkholderia tagetis TaxID=2913261 RepID=A0A9X1ULD3_9BURK|nr:BPSL0761 family protein [Paraburkholderia tagetis]MCG5077519.1 hypothetical protein [Paraburkholderia tagetis]